MYCTNRSLEVDKKSWDMFERTSASDISVSSFISGLLTVVLRRMGEFE